ncbi:MAG: hypothetical protein HOP12_05190 [Candidatus Eisenbacteria bacterium]|uniref:Uncharacterized protein n=1 Tax=Eiseniibacteriota bacterium TaxID=2212470 RepID=A0A849SGG6_UNCEI|nr:hypothetical protein [Candidatus Eisenbacteria bacterium]
MNHPSHSSNRGAIALSLLLASCLVTGLMLEPSFNAVVTPVGRSLAVIGMRAVSNGARLAHERLARVSDQLSDWAPLNARADRRVLVMSTATSWDAQVANCDGPEDATAAGGKSEKSSSYSFRNDDFSMALIEPGKGSTVWMSNSDDTRMLGRLQREEKGPFMWFRKSGAHYIVRDPETLDDARDIVGPQELLGRSQGRLGARQGSFGGAQGRLGARQGRLGARMGTLAGREVKLQLALQSERLSSSERRDIERSLDRLEVEREAIQNEMEALSSQQSELGAVQSQLGAVQAELGARQAEISKRVGREMRALADRAMRDGTARRLRFDSY